MLASKYKSEHEDLTIIACGPSVPEAMRAAYILKQEFGFETRVVNLHTIKPLDTATIIRAAAETSIVLTAEEHQVGGFGNWIAATITQAKELYGKPVITGMIGVKDRFGESGSPWELVKEFEVSAEHIAAKAKELVDFARRRARAQAPTRAAAPKVAKRPKPAPVSKRQSRPKSKKLATRPRKSGKVAASKKRPAAKKRRRAAR